MKLLSSRYVTVLLTDLSKNSITRDSILNIILLQETHFRSNIPKLANKEFLTVLHTTNSIAKTIDVAILLSKNLPLEIRDSLVDDEGHYLFMKGFLWGKSITIANIQQLNPCSCQIIIQSLFLPNSLKLLTSQRRVLTQHYSLIIIYPPLKKKKQNFSWITTLPTPTPLHNGKHINV